MQRVMCLSRDECLCYAGRGEPGGGTGAAGSEEREQGHSLQVRGISCG